MVTCQGLVENRFSDASSPSPPGQQWFGSSGQKANGTIRGPLISAFRRDHTYVIPERRNYLLFVVIF